MKDLLNLRLSMTDYNQTNYRDVQGVPKTHFKIFKDMLFWPIFLREFGSRKCLIESLRSSGPTVKIIQQCFVQEL